MRARRPRQYPPEILWRQCDTHGVDFKFSRRTAIGTRGGGVVETKGEARELGYDGGAAVLHVCWDKEFLRAHCY